MHVACRFVLVLAVTILGTTSGQIVWGAGPAHHSDTDDIENQKRLHDLLRKAYFWGYADGSRRHQLLPSIQSEIASFRRRAEQSPSLALGTAMARYYFSWYSSGTSATDTMSLEDAANLMYRSIQFSSCNQPDLPLEAFVQRMCTYRWPYAVMFYSLLGREFAERYLTVEAASTLEKAVFAFDEMKRLPYFAPFGHWQDAYDINFNELWFPAAQQSGPVWEKSRVPLAEFLENSLGLIQAEFSSLLHGDAFEQLHFENSRAEAEDHSPAGSRHAVHLMTGVVIAQGQNVWDTAACRQMPRTCAKLALRPELQGCRHASASLVRLRAGGRLKPNFGAAPKLTCDLTLQASHAAVVSVGNRTVPWMPGEAIVYDDTFIRQESHLGVNDLYVLRVAFCHPCEDSQRVVYGTSVACPKSHGVAVTAATTMSPQAALRSPGSSLVTSPSSILAPFAAAALWAMRLPGLAKCKEGISDNCRAGTLHDGATPASALRTWNYAFNNVKAALRFANVTVDPALFETMLKEQALIPKFLNADQSPDLFGRIVGSFMLMSEALSMWLQTQGPVKVPLLASADTNMSSFVNITSDGSGSPSTVSIPLSNGVAMPLVGLSTRKLKGRSCYDAVLMAFRSGVRRIHIAEAHDINAEIGTAMKDSGVPRSELFIVGEVTSLDVGNPSLSTFAGIVIEHLQALKTEYLDVYMIHAMGVKGEQLRAVWQELERVFDMGRVRALGISGLGIADVEELLAFARIKPVYMRSIFNVYTQGEQIPHGATISLLHWARAVGITLASYPVSSPGFHLMPPLEDPHVLSIAKAHGRTPSQVLYRWALQSGIAMIAEASLAEHIRESVMLFDFELSRAEMSALNGLETLCESTDSEVLPMWSQDVFGLLVRPAFPGGVTAQKL
eukprot:TRINITY_DN37080_c0_g1_i1.p1 TRINITY_DN37080_c0_g1~~TRINITY_DN37080_c0_g1_i1.p1  ORF type:complete len:898 (+),score=113.63 TRINITY_DN37080_c0_g1_i1:52-2745(+)